MSYLLLFVTGALFVITFTMIINIFVFPRLAPRYAIRGTPLISILIPARNEGDVIAETVCGHLSQTYEHIEVIVLDDQSTDGTAQIAQDASNQDHRFRVINGEPLPAGWSGKSWACHTLAQHASGDILVFTDADVIWQPQALESVIGHMQYTNVDLYTVWSTPRTISMAERLTVPLISMVILGYLPVIMTHHSPFAMFAAANGQCMAWRRHAYEAIGGHQTVANNVLDDVTLARETKKHGYQLRMADGNTLISTRMYTDWQSVRDGFAKNILAGYGNSVFALALATVFHWLVFIIPWFALLLSPYSLWATCLIILGIGTRALSATFSHQRIIDALLMPISVLLMTCIAIQSVQWHLTGGPRWKGRTLGDQSSKESHSWQTDPSS